MRWVLLVTVILCILLGVYFVSPLIALHRMATAVETRDAVALSERIEFPSLRRSLTRQIVTAYLELTGEKLPLELRGQKLQLGALSRRFAISVADPVVARLVTVTALMDLLGKGEAGENVKVQIDRAPLALTSFKNAWRLWLNTDHLGRNFYVYLPPEDPHNEQFRVHLRLSKWRWKLVGIDLPEDLKQQLAQELVKLIKE
jgi:Protein of unknown function (DUF2939)